MPQSDSKAWMLAWYLFAAMPLVGAVGVFRQHTVVAAVDDASSIMCPDLGRRAVEQRERRHASRARDGALAVVLLLAQGPRAVALR